MHIQMKTQTSSSSHNTHSQHINTPPNRHQPVSAALQCFRRFLCFYCVWANERTKQQPESEMNQTREEEKNHIYNITHIQNNSQFAQFYSVVWLHKSMCLCSQFVYIFRMLAFDCVECNVLSSL